MTSNTTTNNTTSGHHQSKNCLNNGLSTYSSQASPLLKQKPFCHLPFVKGKTGGGRFLKICFRKGVATFLNPFRIGVAAFLAFY